MHGEVKTDRFLELEGLRGVAAVMVALYHFSLAFYLYTFLGPNSPMVSVQNNRLEDNLYGNPIMVFVSGTFAVAIFFVLSGFVLSIGFFKKKDVDSVRRMAAKRYFRLMLPALASIMVCLVALSLGLGHIQEAAAVTHSGWLSGAWTFSPDFYTAVKNGVFDIFVVGGNGYNNVLWTMQIEFAGSFIVYAFLVFFGTARYRIFGYALLTVLLFNTWFVAFIAGMALADLYASGVLVQLRRRWFVFLLIPIALFFGGYPIRGADGTVYAYITNPNLNVNWMILYLSIGATLLVGSVLCIKQFASIFRAKALSTLGRYTFALYLMHVPVLYVFGTFIFISLYKTAGLGFNGAAIATILLSMPIVACATYLFERYVDAPSIRFASRIGNIILGYEEAPRKLKRILKAVVSPPGKT